MAVARRLLWTGAAVVGLCRDGLRAAMGRLHAARLGSSVGMESERPGLKLPSEAGVASLGF